MRYRLGLLALGLALSGMRANAQTIEDVCAASLEAMQSSAVDNNTLYTLLTGYMTMVYAAAEADGPASLEAQKTVAEAIAPTYAEAMQKILDAREEHMTKLGDLCGWKMPVE